MDEDEEIPSMDNDNEMNQDPPMNVMNEDDTVPLYVRPLSLISPSTLGEI